MSVVPLQKSLIPADDASEKELQRISRLARLMRRQEKKLRNTIKTINEADTQFAVSARIGPDGRLFGIEEIEFTFLKLTK